MGISNEHWHYVQSKIDTAMHDIAKVILNGTADGRIDHLLGKYYETCGKKDYFDENNNGKFSLFLNKHQLTYNTIIAELESQVNPKESKLALFDSKNNSYPHEMYEAIQFIHKYKHVPITMRNFHILSSNEYSLKWEHIGNAINHELYETISKTFMQLVKSGKTKFKTADDILTKLRKKTKIDQNEIKYIQFLIQRAIRFFYPLNSTDNNSSQGIIPTPVICQLNTDTLCDIYNVHNCFLYMNFNFQQYEESEIMCYFENA
eukprot:383219_1